MRTVLIGRYAICAIAVLLFSTALAQDCYKKLADVSGLAKPDLSVELESAASGIRDVISIGMRSSFLVLDASLYSLRRQAKDGFAGEVASVVEASEQQTASFVLFVDDAVQPFGRWNSCVIVALQKVGGLTCLTPEAVAGIEYSLSAYLGEFRELAAYEAAKIECLRRLERFLVKVQDCCLHQKSPHKVVSIDTALLSVELCIDNSCRVDPQYSVALVSSSPNMPQISFQLRYSGGGICAPIRADLFILYKRSTNVTLRNRNDSLRITISDVLTDVPYIYDFGDDFQGGRAEIQIRDSDGAILKVHKFYIKGLNPTAREVYEYIDDRGYLDTFWFFKKMVTHESGSHPSSLAAPIKQFNIYRENKENLGET